ncbi:hypothetical protein CAPTEDRAFT_224758 [Capitella teleta]|uniref:PDZ domain-containing protein n=1 Tax=Capitella teleta TaxID=283909 RepID=R7V3D7_CAPTE|nr:hypothetical protein CAPTEDRAFT_224758 [Capitella teleta]|eukprot:ELU10310.1 hypothetical protein CAPTEDRAFT_224758 [Capitella teleta]
MFCGVKRARSSVTSVDRDASVHYGHDCLPSKRRSRRGKKIAIEDKENAHRPSPASKRTPKRPNDSFAAHRPWVNSSFVPFFSPAAARVDLDDTYCEMSLSYNQPSVFTASLNSQTYDYSPDQTLQSSTDPGTPINVSMVTTSSRPDPVKSMTGLSDYSFLSSENTIPTPKQTLEWSSISASTDPSVVSGADHTLEMDKQTEDEEPTLSSEANTSEISGDLSSRSPVIVHRKIKGLLRIAVDLLEEDDDIVVVRVLEGKGIKGSDTFVQTQFILDGKPIEGTSRRSQVFRQSSSPAYNHSVTLTMSRNMSQQRLMVSVLEQTRQTRQGYDGSTENMLGCMSFKVSSMVSRTRRQVVSTKSSTESWYCLLPEGMGLTKHMPLTDKLIPKVFGGQDQCSFVCDTSTEAPCTPILKATKIVIPKAIDGYGFTVKGSKPVRVGRVTQGSTSYSSGLLHDDYILTINGKDVSQSSPTTVAKIVRDSSVQVAMEILRPVTSVDKRAVTTGSSNLASASAWNPGLSIIQEDRTLERKARLSVSNTKDSLLYNETYRESPATKWNPDISFIAHAADPKSNFMNESSLYEEVDDPSFLEEGFHTTNDISIEDSWIEDTAESAMNSVWSEATTLDSCLADEFHSAQKKIVRCQQCFVNSMTKGVQQFSKPLRYRILRSHQHSTLFQNVDKLVVVCDWLLKDLTSAVESSVGDFVDVFSRRLNLVCEAFQIYLSGLPKALTLLQQLNQNRDFVAFLNSSYQKDFIMTMENFLEKPVQHIIELVSLLECFKSSSTESEKTHLDSVIDALKNSVENAASADRKRSSTLSRLSSSSLDSGISQCSTFSNSRAPRGSSLLANNACTSQHLNGSSGYMSMSRLTDSQLNRSNNIDQPLNDLQNRLNFSANIKPFNVAAPHRHIVFNSDVTYGAHPCTAWLCNDLLLLTSRGVSAQVLAAPVFLKDIVEMDFVSDDDCKFSLTSSSEMKPIELSTSNSGEKHAWRSLLQHHHRQAKCLTC